MAENEFETLIEFPDLRDILGELDGERATAITTRINELVEAALVENTQKLDGLHGYDKKDGGKDCGTDGKEEKETSDDKETCDLPEDYYFRFGDPSDLDTNRMSAVLEAKAGRLLNLLSSDNPIM